MTTALTLRPELDRLRCEEPGCDCVGDNIVIECRHCDGAPMVAVYSKGELELECAECERPVLRVPVAG